jgi:hypothetical protein
VNDGGPGSSVEQFDPNEYVSNGGLQTGELDALTRESAGTGFDRVAGQGRIGQLLGRGLPEVTNVFGEPESYWELHAGESWGPPKEAVLAGSGFLDFEVSGSRLVGPDGGDEEQK